MKRTFATIGVIGLGLISLSPPAMADPNTVIVCHAGGTSGAGWEAIEFNVNGLKGHDRHPADIIPPNGSLVGGLNWTNAGKILYIENCAPLPPGETPPVYPPVVEEPPIVVEEPPLIVEEPPLIVEEPPIVIEDPPVVVDPLEVVVDPPVVVDPLEVVVDPPAGVDPPVVVSDPPAVVVETPVQRSPVVSRTPATVTPTVQTPGVPARAQAPAGAAAAAVSQGTNQGYNAQTAAGGTDTAPTWLAGLGMMLGAGALVAVRRRSLEAPAD